MSRRSRNRSLRRAGPKSAPRAAPRLSGAGLVVATVVLIAGAAFVALRLTPRGSPAGAPADSLAAMDPAQALARGVALGRQGRHTQSLPYFRRAVDAGGWTAHWNYAAAMNNAAFEVWDRHGMLSPASRSSIERLELMRQAEEEMRTAEREVPDRRTLAMLELVRGRTLELWGFPLDALEAYRRALIIDSTSATPQRMIDDCVASLRGGSAAASR